MKLIAFTDGASRGNPGEAGIGIVLKDEHGVVLAKHKKYLGKTTNNNAEYSALLECINFVLNSETFHCSELVVNTDSELMARQLNGKYKVKEEGLKVLFQNVRIALASSSFKFSISHIPRSLNKEADALANEAIDLHNK